LGIGGVDDGIHRETRDVSDMECDAGIHGHFHANPARFAVASAFKLDLAQFKRQIRPSGPKSD
jgi:hypothetical protein